MVVNFRAREISRGARKLARTPTLKKKKKKENNEHCKSKQRSMDGVVRSGQRTSPCYKQATISGDYTQLARCGELIAFFYFIPVVLICAIFN
jgi:hypothetical protein